MIIVSIDQAKRRHKTLPPELKDAIFAPETSDAIWRVAEDRHLSEQKTSDLGRVAGLVLLGFIHKEDCWKDIQDALAIGPEISKDLQKGLERELFSKYSSFLEKSFNPKIETEPSETKQTLDSLIRKAQPIPYSLSMNDTAKAEPEPAKPITLTVKPSAPATKPNVPPPAAMPIGIVPATPSNIVAPKPTDAKAPSTPAPAPQKPAPAPFMIHAEAVPPPVVQAPKFRMDTMGGSMFGAGKAPNAPPPTKPAQIEIGREEKLKSVPTSGKIESAERVIHYSPLSSPISPAGRPASATAPVVAASFGSFSAMPARKEAVAAPSPSTPRAPTGPTPAKEPLFPSKPITPFTSSTKVDLGAAFNPPVPTASPAARQPVSIPINKPLVPPSAPKPPMPPVVMPPKIGI